MANLIRDKKVSGSKPFVFNAVPVQSEVISASRYLALTEVQRKAFAETCIVAPTLGSGGFGGLLVTYKVPIYKARAR